MPYFLSFFLSTILETISLSLFLDLSVHVSCLLVAHPGMGSSSSRVDPHDVLEPKVVSQGDIDDLDCHSHELPALVANIGLIAAGSDIVIVSQINIEAQLLREWLE